MEFMIQYMDSLSKAHQAGHRVDSEIREVIRQLRIELGIETQSSIIKREVVSKAEGDTRSILWRLRINGVIDEDVYRKACEEINKPYT